MTRNQLEALTKIDHDEWHAIDIKNIDPSKIPFGGTTTLLNLKGDVMKVYADGTVQIVTSEDFRSLLYR